jgi:ATP-dependent DNA helicase RecG
MFDSPEELLRKINLGEDSTLELKRVTLKGKKVSDPARDDLADEIAAMANTADSVLVLGVDDKTRDIAGIPQEALDAVERFVFEVCCDSVRPPVAFRTLRLELPDSTGTLRAVMKVDIPRSLFVHESPGGYFQRQGSSKRKLPPDLLARLFQQRSQSRLIRFDEQAVPSTSLSDLEPALWQRFVGNTAADPVETLRKLHLLTEDDAGVERATVAAILMCTEAPETWLRNAYIEAVRYRGNRQDSNYQIDAHQIIGPLDQQVRHALAFVERNMTIAATKAPGRVELPQYSKRAVFEALVNAVAHRDYAVHGSKIRLFMFDDRLELFSPGPPPNSVTVQSMALRQATRNELIAGLLTRSPVVGPSGVGRQYFMEKRGDGVPIILAESTELSGREPEYRLIDDSELLLTIWAAAVPAETPAPA